MTEFNTMQRLKRRFFAMRNGITANLLRRGGSPHAIIFGLNLPQLKEIAEEFGPDDALGERLWMEDSRCRESMMIAPMLTGEEYFGEIETARRWIEALPAGAVEAVDILCMKRLRGTDYGLALVGEYSDDEEDTRRYLSLRLAFNLLPKGIEQAEEIARKELERNCRMTAMTSRRLLDEITFLRE